MPRHESLEIHVHRNGSGHKPGTFTGPPPKMRIDVGDYLQWTLKVEPPDDTAFFVIKFQGFSWPFAGDPVLFGDNNERQVVNAGSYLYAVQVRTVDGVYNMDRCPEADVGG